MTARIASTHTTGTRSSSLSNLTKDNRHLGFATKNGSTDREPVPPLVSIVMAVYNQERYLAQAIASVIGQTYTNFELIIWNDGSSDRSLEIAQEYADQNKKIPGYTETGMSGSKWEGRTWLCLGFGQSEQLLNHQPLNVT